MRLQAHAHERAYVAFPLRGAYDEMWRGYTDECRSGMAIFHPPGEEHADRFSSIGGLVFNLEFSTEWVRNAMETGNRLPPRTVVRHGGLFMLGLRFCYGLRQDVPLQNLDLEEFGVALFSELGHLCGAPPPKACADWMKRCLDLLQACWDEPWTLASIAEQVGVHPVHLARQFRRTHHCTVGGYIRRLRAQHAAEMLINTDEPLCQIAAKCGFSDQSHMTRLLRGCVGATPKRLRSLIPETR